MIPLGRYHDNIPSYFTRAFAYQLVRQVVGKLYKCYRSSRCSQHAVLVAAWKHFSCTKFTRLLFLFYFFFIFATRLILVYLGFKLGLAHIVAQSVLIQMDDLQPANRRLLRKGCRHGNGLRGQHDPKTASNSRLNKLKLRIFGDFFFCAAFGTCCIALRAAVVLINFQVSGKSH